MQWKEDRLLEVELPEGHNEIDIACSLSGISKVGDRERGCGASSGRNYGYTGQDARWDLGPADRE